ncbi:MAG: hypothetical protein M3Z54_13745, partial [Gemmatimonadota bacterium]|nr:hypothetical protein [Gemmatimonadota bacterium]
ARRAPVPYPPPHAAGGPDALTARRRRVCNFDHRKCLISIIIDTSGLRRRRAVRAVLSAAAVLQLSLLSGLPLRDQSAGERQAFLTLATLFLLTVGGSVALRCRPTAATTALGIAAAYSVYGIGRVAWSMREVIGTPGASAGASAEALSYALPLTMFATSVLGFALAWPLRQSDEARLSNRE